MMGAGIAQVSVECGYKVLMKDENNAGIARGEAQIKANLDQKVKKKSLRAFDRDTLLSKVTSVTPDNVNWLKHFSNADVVIEAVPENLALKHKVVRCLCSAAVVIRAAHASSLFCPLCTCLRSFALHRSNSWSRH